MPSMRDIRRRITSVANIQQITRAMKMVAAAKLRRIQGRMLAMRPYTQEVAALMGRFFPQLLGAEHPLLERREARRVGVLFCSGERGLCGSHNTNLAREFPTVRSAGMDYPAALELRCPPTWLGCASASTKARF